MSSSKKRVREDDAAASPSINKHTQGARQVVDVEGEVLETPDTEHKTSPHHHQQSNNKEQQHEEGSYSADAKLIQDEYRIWKKNSPFLYDVLLSHPLTWPSLTVEWMPDQHRPEGKDYYVQRLILGTNTNQAEQDYLMIAEVRLPSPDAVIDAREFAESDAAGLRVEGDSNSASNGAVKAGSYGGPSGKFDVIQRIPHRQEVNRARYMPQNPDLIATRSADPTVFLFDRTHYSSKPAPDAPFSADLSLVAHHSEGYGLAWNQREQGRLVTCGEDRLICVWDIQKGTKDHRTITPLVTIADAHEDNICDVSWHAHHPQLFASCGDDRIIRLWDLRTPAFHTTSSSTTVSGTALAAAKLIGHSAAINTLSFSPFSEHLLFSGSDDRSVGLFDLRRPTTMLHALHAHVDSVLQVVCSPFNADVIASASADRRVNVWDLSRLGDARSTTAAAQTAAEEEDTDDAPPELLFVHGGHTDKIGEISWNAVEGEEWMMASVADDNIVQVWQIAENIINDDEEEGAGEEESSNNNTTIPHSDTNNNNNNDLNKNNTNGITSTTPISNNHQLSPLQEHKEEEQKEQEALVNKKAKKEK